MTYRVVAAIDFGTHGSGFAWAVLPAGADAPGERQIDYPDQWDDAPLTYPKNLSALFLDPDGNDRHWGYSARRASAAEEEGRLEHGFKMWLRREGRDAARDPGAGLVGTPERAVPLIAAYLRRLRGAALDRIVGGGGFLESDIRWCLTVPAIWEPEERNLMREAARQAGFPAHDRNRLILVTEPEAATVYCAQDAAAGIGGLGSLATLVVDCGGGTVDIAAYRCRGDGSLEQLRPPSGGKLGSNFINRRFQVQVLRPRLGQAAFKALEAAPAQLMELMDAFERLKTGFRDGDSAVRIPISLKASRIIDPHGGSQRLAAEQQGVDDHIVIEPDVMRGLFQGTTEPLQKLVSTQIRELLADPAVAAEGLRVILVGGFAQSPYVQSRLGQHIDKEFPAGVQLMIPPNPSRAVLGGAVHYACRPEVVHSRRASHTYAVEVSTRRRFGGVLRESGAVRALGITRVRGQGAFRDGVLDPLVLMGESVRVGSERTHSLLPLSKEQSELEVALYAVPAVKGLTVKTPGARLLGTVVVDIRDSVGEDVEDRVVDLHFTFGGTEIGVTVVNRRTQARLDTVVEFAGVPE